MTKQSEILSVVCFKSEKLQVLHNYILILSKLTSKNLLIFNRIIASLAFLKEFEDTFDKLSPTSRQKSFIRLIKSPKVTTFIKTLTD